MLDSHLLQRAKARLGKTLRGKWVLEDLVGVGGMAAVYRSRHRNGACGAVKILHPTLADNEELRRRFVGEGYAANRINHPAVVRVHDDDLDEDGTPFLVMDFVEGETLADKIQDRRLNDDELLDVAEQVCSALEAAHAAGVVHRDLKPDNLLMDPEGRIRMLDFGIARLLEEDHESFFSTKTGIAFGTPGFISPEQALGHRHKVGPRTDLFALGATLFYLATGEFLHAAETPQELLIMVATRPARPLRSVAPHVSEDVAALIDRATRMSLEARWQSAREMLDRVHAIQEARRKGTAIASLPPTNNSPDPIIEMVETRDRLSLVDVATRPSIVRSVERRRRSVLGVGAAVAMVVGAFTFLSALRSPLETRVLQSETHAVNTAVSDQAPPEHLAVNEVNEVQIASKPAAAAPPAIAKKSSPPKPPAKKKADPAKLIDALLARKN